MDNIFIINPTAGNKKGLYAGIEIEKYLKEKNVDFKIYYTSKKGDATDIAKEYRQTKCNIYSVGGDGIINEIVNGIIDGKPSLSIIPVGSGNDFYKSFKNFNGNFIDLGMVNNRYFINIASLGLDAVIANDANNLKKYNLSSDIIYIMSLIKNFLNYPGFDSKVDEKIKNLIILTICNASYYGGGFNIAPNAILDDGFFDIIEVNKLNKIKLLKLLSKLIKVKHLSDKNVNYYISDEIIVESKIPLLCNIDGEIFKDTSFIFTNYQEAIRINNKNELGILDMLKEKKLVK